MTRRALFLGLLCAVLLNGVTYFNDFVLRQNYLIGTQMPIAVYGVLVLFLIGVYPWLNRWTPLAALRASEITVILAMSLVACAVPSTNLMRGFAPTLMMPHHYNRINPGWAESGLLEQVPDFIHPQTGDDDDALSGFIQGIGASPTKSVMSRIP